MMIYETLHRGRSGVGGMFEIAFPRKRTSLQFRTGYTRQNFADGSAESKPYFGAGIYRRF